MGGPSSLGATNTGLRILRHVGGSVPDVLACVEYVNSCVTAEGGFAATPGGKPEFVTTALGLMAASELKISDPKMIRGAVAYLGKHAGASRRSGWRSPAWRPSASPRPISPGGTRRSRTCGTRTGPSGPGRARRSSPAGRPPRSSAWD